MPPALGLVPFRPLGALSTRYPLPLLCGRFLTMPLLLRRRQEPKSARRMCPFMSSKTLSGLTSLGEAGRVRGLTCVCGGGIRHMTGSICMGTCTPKQCVSMHVGGGKCGGQASWLPGRKKVGKGIHNDEVWRQQGVLWGMPGSSFTVHGSATNQLSHLEPGRCLPVLNPNFLICKMGQ